MNIEISVDDSGLVFWLRTISYMQSMGNWKGELPSVEEKRFVPLNTGLFKGSDLR